MRYLNVTDIREIDRMTFWEYNLRMRAFNLKQIDRDQSIYLSAWLIREAQAKKKKGKNGLKYVYGEWKDFFDYDARIRAVSGKEGIESRKPSDSAQRAVEYMRRKRDGEL